MKSLIFTILLFGTLLDIQSAYGQNYSYFDGKFRVANYTQNGHPYTLYDFSREGIVMKAKYFAQNAHNQYLNWKSGKQILFITAGAFSSTWDPGAVPVGLCVDNGVIVNKSIDFVMDGMVVVYNGAAQIGGIGIDDMAVRPMSVEEPIGSGNKFTYSLRSSAVDRSSFLSWGATAGVTLFQTQLIYSSDKSINANLNNPYYGDPRERRFLAICKKGGVIHHVIVDAPDKVQLNLSASYAKAVLEYDGFSVLYILNLDTGGKNILHVYNGSYLVNKRPNPNTKIEDATNLLIYYKDPQ